MKPADFIRHAGGPVKIARALGLRSHTSVLKWTAIPVKHVAKLESEFGIPREKLRPDIFCHSTHKGEAA
mgnify:CR=1 FL=1